MEVTVNGLLRLLFLYFSLLNFPWMYEMLLHFSDLQTKHQQTMTENAACNSNQPRATGLTKGI